MGILGAMSGDNVELIRTIYEDGLLDEHPERLLELVAPEVEYVNPPEAVESGTRRGVEEVARALVNASQAFESYRHELHRLFDAGDRVVASVTFWTRSRGSETEVSQEEAHTWTLRDGRIVRFKWERDLGAALAAVGLRQDPAL